MTPTEQRRWLLQEQQTCERLINEPMVIGACLREKARADLAVIQALLVTLDTAYSQSKLFPQVRISAPMQLTLMEGATT